MQKRFRRPCSASLMFLPYQEPALSLACIMYINEFILYPVSYRNRINIILQTDDIIRLTSNRELNLDPSAFQLPA